MRKMLFSEDQILDHFDANEIGENGVFETSNLLLGMSARPLAAVDSWTLYSFGVLNGLVTTATANADGTATVNITPGVIAYVVNDSAGKKWRTAYVDAQTLTLPAVSGTNVHQVHLIEASVAEVTDTETRQFRRNVAGRTVISNEATGVRVRAQVTLSYRSGTQVATSSVPTGPNWSLLDPVLPIAHVRVTDTPSTEVRDLRKLYRGSTGDFACMKPMRVTVNTGKSGSPKITIAHNLIGFGERNAFDYVPVTLSGTAGNVETGGTMPPFETGFTPALNSCAYVYAVRDYWKAGTLSLVITNKPHTTDRHLSPGYTLTPSSRSWAPAALVGGPEAVYLFTLFFGQASVYPTAMDLANDEYVLTQWQPTKLVSGANNGTHQVMDLSAMLPIYATTGEVQFHLSFGTTTVTSVSLATNYLGPSYGYGSANDFILTPVASGGGSTAEIWSRPLSVMFADTSTYMSDRTFAYDVNVAGTAPNPFDLTCVVKKVREVLAQ